MIDSHGRLVGIVTLDDVIDVAEEEATREIQKFGGLEALDEPYMSTPLLEMVRKRATWLVILFVGEMLHRDGDGLLRGTRSPGPSSWPSSCRSSSPAEATRARRPRP